MTNKLCDDWVLYDCSICGECHEEENKDRDRENEQLQDLRTEMNQMKIKLEEMMKINDNYQREERKKVTDDDINKDSGTESKSKMSTSKTSSAKSKKTVIDATTATGTERPLCTTDTDVVLTRQMDEILTLREANISLNNKLKDKDRQLTKFADLVGVYKEQANAYKEDFKKERQDRERLMDELLWYKEKVNSHVVFLFHLLVFGLWMFFLIYSNGELQISISICSLFGCVFLVH